MKEKYYKIVPRSAMNYDRNIMQKRMLGTVPAEEVGRQLFEDSRSWIRLLRLEMLT